MFSHIGQSATLLTANIHTVHPLTHNEPFQQNVYYTNAVGSVGSTFLFSIRSHPGRRDAHRTRHTNPIIKYQDRGSLARASLCHFTTLPGFDRTCGQQKHKARVWEGDVVIKSYAHGEREIGSRSAPLSAIYPQTTQVTTE